MTLLFYESLYQVQLHSTVRILENFSNATESWRI